MSKPMREGRGASMDRGGIGTAELVLGFRHCAETLMENKGFGMCEFMEASPVYQSYNVPRRHSFC